MQCDNGRQAYSRIDNDSNYDEYNVATNAFEAVIENLLHSNFPL